MSNSNQLGNPSGKHEDELDTTSPPPGDYPPPPPPTADWPSFVGSPPPPRSDSYPHFEGTPRRGADDDQNEDQAEEREREVTAIRAELARRWWQRWRLWSNAGRNNR